MADVFDKATRSTVMRKIHSTGNKSTEIRLIDLFKTFNLKGWRRNYPVIGKPDFVFLKQRVVIFVDGCFWHGHDCRNTRPSDNAEYWARKRERNKNRDSTITGLFELRGWSVLRIWECELSKANQALTIERIKVALCISEVDKETSPTHKPNSS